MRPSSLRFLNHVQGVNVNNLTELVVAITVGIVVGLAAGMAGMAMLRRARLRREVRELDPWWQWQKQWQRVEIGLRRVDAIYEGRQVDSADDLYDVLSFFLNCHHLRDWLAADKLSRMSGKKASRVIKRSTHLRVCADLANRTSQASVTPCSNDTGTSPTRQRGNDHSGSDAARRWEVEAGDAIYDAFDLALNCVADWERALTGRGLLDAR